MGIPEQGAIPPMQTEDTTSGRRLTRNQFLEGHHATGGRRLRVRCPHDRLGDIDAAPDLALGNPVHGRELHPRPFGEGATRSVYQLDVLRKPHAEDDSRNRELRQPKSVGKILFAEFGYRPAGEAGGVDEPKSVSAVVEALRALVEAGSAATICDQTGIPRTTLDRILETNPNAGKGFRTDNWDKLMKLPECRTAAIRALQATGSRDPEWALLAGELGRVLSPALGWRISKAFHRLAKEDRVFEGVAALEGLVSGIDESIRAQASAAKSKRNKGKQESS